MVEFTIVRYITEALISSEHQLNTLDRQFDPKNGGKIGGDVVLFAQAVGDRFSKSNDQSQVTSNKTEPFLPKVIAEVNRNVSHKGKTMILNYFQIILDEIVQADLTRRNNKICTEDCQHNLYPICKFVFTLEKSIEKLQKCYEMNQHALYMGGNSSKDLRDEMTANMDSDCYNLNIKDGFVDSLSVLLGEFMSHRLLSNELELLESMVIKLEEMANNCTEEPINPTHQIFATLMRAFLEGIKFGYIKNVMNLGEQIIELD